MLVQIRGAIQEYQIQLIDSVKKDIKRLHDKVPSTFASARSSADSARSSRRSTASPRHSTCRRRALFDTRETQRAFGGVAVFDYERVQTRVNAKYDAWQPEILGRVGAKLGAAMKEMHAAITKACGDLKYHSVEGIVGGMARRS
jgi:hypothetical protein